MTKPDYAIDTGDGNQLCAGLPEETAREVAQRRANELRCPVYLYQMTETGEKPSKAEAFYPVPQHPAFVANICGTLVMHPEHDATRDFAACPLCKSYFGRKE